MDTQLDQAGIVGWALEEIRHIVWLVLVHENGDRFYTHSFDSMQVPIPFSSEDH